MNRTLEIITISMPGVYLQECCCNSIHRHLFSVCHQVFHLSSELRCCGTSLKSCKQPCAFPIKQWLIEKSRIWYWLWKPCMRDNAASLQEAMFSVIHHGDTLSACWRDHKCFRPVCMCMKQFVSLHSHLTPRSPPTCLPPHTTSLKVNCSSLEVFFFCQLYYNKTWSIPVSEEAGASTKHKSMSWICTSAARDLTIAYC